MKKFLLYILGVMGFLMFSGCTNPTEKAEKEDAIRNAIVEVENGNYEEAEKLLSFGMLDNKSANQKNHDMHLLLKKFLEAKQLFEDNKLIDAEEVLTKIEDKDLDDNLTRDIELLKEKIKENITDCYLGDFREGFSEYWKTNNYGYKYGGFILYLEQRRRDTLNIRGGSKTFFDGEMKKDGQFIKLNVEDTRPEYEENNEEFRILTVQSNISGSLEFVGDNTFRGIIREDTEKTPDNLKRASAIEDIECEIILNDENIILTIGEGFNYSGRYELNINQVDS
ncbi:MAG: hypothetical protein ACRC57_13745 [Sarcina sp.]